MSKRAKRGKAICPHCKHKVRISAKGVLIAHDFGNGGACGGEGVSADAARMLSQRVGLET